MRKSRSGLTSYGRKTHTGFTIVELLIVIVVIAILAAISIVAYTGIQQRAKNASIISSANQVLKAIAGYSALNGRHPVTSNNQFCAVPAEDGACTAHSTVQRIRSTIFDNNIATIATLPTSVPRMQSEFMGITINYSTTTTVNGEVRPMLLQYSLSGEQQQCGTPNVTMLDGGGARVSSTTGYTSSTGGYTLCMVSVP